MEDSQIVELYLSRDESAVAHTGEKYGARLRAIAHRITEDPGAAEECENDTYLEAWNAIPPHEPRSYLFAFLARITRHLALDRCKERSRQKRSGQLVPLTREMEQCIPSPHDPEKVVDARLLSAAVSAFLRTIGQEQRNIFLRRYWYLDSVSDIAARFSISQSKVKTTLFRTRNALKQYLKKEDFLV